MWEDFQECVPLKYHKLCKFIKIKNNYACIEWLKFVCAICAKWVREEN